MQKSIQNPTPIRLKYNTGEIVHSLRGDLQTSSTGYEDLDKLLGGGYPEQSTILIIGPPGIGKEALIYSFLRIGMEQRDCCIFASRLKLSEALQDSRGYGVEMHPEMVWLEAGRSFHPTALTEFSVGLKRCVAENVGRLTRISTDALSAMVRQHSAEVIYRFLTSLLQDLMNRRVVFLATLEEGMHDQKDVVALEQLFDGVIEMRFYEEGLMVTPLLRVRKMRGIAPLHGYFRFNLVGGRLNISAYAR